MKWVNTDIKFNTVNDTNYFVIGADFLESDSLSDSPIFADLAPSMTEAEQYFFPFDYTLADKLKAKFGVIELTKDEVEYKGVDYANIESDYNRSGVIGTSTRENQLYEYASALSSSAGAIEGLSSAVIEESLVRELATDNRATRRVQTAILESIQPDHLESNTANQSGVFELDNGSGSSVPDDNLQELSRELSVINYNPNHYFSDFEDTKFSTSKVINDNFKAIFTLRAIKQEDRLATEEERRILDRYKGFGGVATDSQLPTFFEIFDKYKDDPHFVYTAEEYKELAFYSDIKNEYLRRGYFQIDFRKVLAKLGINDYTTAFYTPPKLCQKIWDSVVKAGFSGGMVLEPSIGTGIFLSTAPKDIVANSYFQGIEKDSFSADLSSALFPDTNIIRDSFENVKFPKNTFDLVIGNVPFSSYVPYDPEHNKYKASLHDYFILKSLDILNENGIASFITATGTLDDTAALAREQMSMKAQFLGAVRLPNKVFKDFSGTDTSVDILFFAGKSVQLEQSIDIHNYFESNPDQVVGRLFKKDRYGKTILLENYDDFHSQLDAALAIIPSNILTKTSPNKAKIADNKAITADSNNYLDGEYVINNDTVCMAVKSNGLLDFVAIDKKIDVEMFKAYKAIHNAFLDCLDSQKRDLDTKLETREKLNSVYDDYVSKYGAINSKKSSVLKDDIYFKTVAALENYTPEKKGETPESISKTDIFFTDVIKHLTVPEVFDSIEDAIYFSNSYFSMLDLEFIAEKTKKSLTHIEEYLDLNPNYFRNPATKDWEGKEKYLSGNVRVKLAEAQSRLKLDAAYQKNVEALEKVIPLDIPIEDINIRLGAAWIDSKVMTKFFSEEYDTEKGFNLDYSVHTGSWEFKVRWSRISEGLFSNRLISLSNIVTNFLNNKEVKILTKDKNNNSIIDIDLTYEANNYLDGLQKRFEEFARANYSKQLAEAYNLKFNAYVAPVYDGSDLILPKMTSVVELLSNQKNAIKRALNEPNILMNHEVGTGKTFSFIAIAMEKIRLGQASKAMVVTPRSVKEQFEKSARLLYPEAKIRVLNAEDISKKRQALTINQIAANNYDLIIVDISTFARIAISPELEKVEIEDQLRLLSIVKSDTKEHFTLKEIQRKERSLEARLKKLSDIEKDEQMLYFDQLGIDLLMIDEAHNFKNLEVTGFIPGSKRAWDLLTKIHAVHNLRGSRSGVILGTATPVSNNVLEIFNILRYTAEDLLEETGLSNPNEWIKTFTSTKMSYEFDPAGGLKIKKRLVMQNLPELMQGLRTVMDVATADTAGISRPDAEVKNVVCKESLVQKYMRECLAVRVNSLKGKDPRVDNLLKIIHEGTVIALEPRLLADGKDMPDYKKGKIYECIDSVSDIYHSTMEDRSTQLVFCSMGTPKPNNNGGLYSMIREGLVQKGLRANEVAFIHDFDTPEKRQNLFNDVRAGNVRVLIGSLQKMSEGVNVQERLIAVHHLDAPWRPSDIEQANGRAIRQGNMNKNVQIYIYTTENSFDVFKWETMNYKNETFTRIIKGECNDRSFDFEFDPTFADTVAITTNNQLQKEKIESKQALERWSSLKQSYLIQQHNLHHDIGVYERIVAKYAEQYQAFKSLPKLSTRDVEIAYELPLTQYGTSLIDFRGNHDHFMTAALKLRSKSRLDTYDFKLFGIDCLYKRGNYYIKDIDKIYLNTRELEKAILNIDHVLDMIDCNIKTSELGIENLKKGIKERFEFQAELEAAQIQYDEVLKNIASSHDPNEKIDPVLDLVNMAMNSDYDMNASPRWLKSNDQDCIDIEVVESEDLVM